MKLKNIFSCCVLLILLIGCNKKNSTFVPVEVRKVTICNKPLFIFVKNQESLSDVARKFKISEKEIIRINNLKSPYRLSKGNKIYLRDVALKKTSRPVIINKKKDIFIEKAIYPERKFISEKYLSENFVIIPPKRSFPVKNNSVIKKIKSNEIKKDIVKKIQLDNEVKFYCPLKGKIILSYGGGPGQIKNDGVNINGEYGTSVYSAASGEVVYSNDELRGFGKLLLIKHKNGWMTAYAHNSKLLVKVGDKVKERQIIAQVGKSGNVSKPQLHFEMRKNSKSVDPNKYLSFN